MKTLSINTGSLTQEVIALVTNSSYTLEDILAMESIDDIVIEGLTAAGHSQLKIFRIMNTGTADTIVSADIAAVRKHFSNSRIVEMLNAPKTFAWFKAIHREFLTNSSLDLELATAFSMFKGEDLLSKRIGEVFGRLPKYAHIGTFSAFELNQAYQALATTIFTGLVETGTIEQKEITKPFIDALGRRRFRTELNVVYDGVDTHEKDPMFGIHSEAGVLMGKRVKAKPGGIAYKYNSTAKDYLKLVSSQALELVVIPREEFIAFVAQEKWYTTKSANFHVIAKREMARGYADLYESLQDRTLYLSMWFDYRYRAYYDFNNPVFGPHSKAGKYFYQATVAELQTEASLHLHIESAVTLALGFRHNVEDALQVWEEASEAIIAELLNTEGKYFGDVLYQRRLVQAIDDIESGEPTKFLLAGDNTNGGLQIFSTEFRETKAREACNVGGLTKPQDSHMPIANAFGVPREVAKDLGQPVVHAGSYRQVAKQLKEATGTEVTGEEVRAFLVEAFGEAIVNIDAIGNFTRSLYDNYNTSLKFTTMDGLPAQSIGFIEHLELDTYGLSMNAKSLYRKIKVTSDMPLVLTNSKKEVIYDAGDESNRQLGQKRKASTKMSGSYANVIHSVDGWSMRTIVTPTVKAGYVGIQVHDMYLYSGNAHAEIIRPQYRRNLLTIEERQPMTTAIGEMNSNRNGEKLPAPKLIYGDSTSDAIKASNCMITA